MRTLIFATNNQNKVKEIRSVLGNDFSIITLKEADIDIDIPEPHDTLEANAKEKSTVIHTLTNKNCFSEDTGLEVEALNGEPGVRSARYAGDETDFKKNIEKLLQNMDGQRNRLARFRTVISLILDKQEYFFEGICNGMITENEAGENGFGYDPVFIPEGAAKTFAQMSLEEKNEYSHRKKATAKLIAFLKEKYGQD
ncbi:MAG TPA: RdgB/HAM1 family non-canonical purine NTP pyrophosphatase [Ferruginibacter sp.]|jgi:XTP/dITP diphosphohydrolase|nr:RdgB/HAM1 family non-canonical purine NTP pyrophosphatase [Bacteroidota bacterium]MCC6693812.1 RdgB/HAM1 family non-canonical purine NTP pyrophosphatase [Chitinophagaceae bacterium]HMT96458.1 RdgB/HAM1 family non-canonical purine NTP pyrophosphatase [Ferruginibacter sp.]MBS1925224.1 RdgB/HAM1 family non-canonical purine NTP pyrophosphatase [Bacteroidota bacterium]HMU24098.1 RdgB/HAM1 family non-canonical purine NTP pyrophosphatase [Ferruginibacter sp.]